MRHNTVLTAYEPASIAYERAPLTLLAAALRVCQRTLRDEYPAMYDPPKTSDYAPLLVATAALIESRCCELLRLLDLHDLALDQARPPHDDDDIPF